MSKVVVGEVMPELPEDGFLPEMLEQLPVEDYIPVLIGEHEAQLVSTAVSKGSETVSTKYRVARFRGRAMIEIYEPFPHFVPLHKERFDKIAYELLGGMTRSRMGDVFSYLGNVAEDLTDMEDFICFGISNVGVDGKVQNWSEFGATSVWDMEAIDIRSDVLPADCVWRSPYAKLAYLPEGSPYRGRIEFIMQLAGNNEGLYDDIMQSLAPLVMRTKPDGVIWWVGDGANGKSTLMDAIYKIFPGQLSSINVKRLSDGRDTPSLNGTLANVVKESSEGRIEDTEIYKSIGTHENFRVHKFHSQDDIEIRGNLHHIFSANQIPSFNDKGYSARRRTFIIPFKQRFESDPGFEKRTFTPEFFGQLVMEICRYARKLKDQGYRYKWSAATLNTKADYDAEANNAEQYTQEIIDQGVVAFTSFNPVRIDYENWCADQGYVPLGIGNLRHAISAVGFERTSVRANDGSTKQYRLRNFGSTTVMPIGMGRPGLFTVVGFQKQADETMPPEFVEPVPKPVEAKKLILNNRW